MKRVLIILMWGVLCFSGCEMENGVHESVRIEKEIEEDPAEQIETDETEGEEKDVEIENPDEVEKEEIEAPEVVEIVKREWNLMIYMSADNNLENAAMEDLCEMECSRLNTDKVTVLVLVDRSAAYDTSNGNWSGTRLYKIETGRGSNTVQMISEQLECEELGLKKDKDIEVDMSSDYVLSSFMKYAIKEFPAEHYGLIIWGHGTGWRGENCEPYKGFAYDETSRTYMSLNQLGIGIENGIGNAKLDVLGFDTCFGGELEVAYELRNYADYMVASEGLIMSSGWDYNQMLSDFGELENLSTQNFTDAILEQFKQQYAYSYRASIAVVDMQKVGNLFDAFDGYFKNYAKKITDSDMRDDVLGVLYGSNSSTEKYSYGTPGNDVYLDIYSMVEQLSQLNNDVNASDFFDIEKTAVVKSWASDRERGGLGVYFSTLTEGNLLSITFPSSYTKGKTVNQIQFVKNSEGYVPCNKTGESFIDKLFFTSY